MGGRDGDDDRDAAEFERLPEAAQAIAAYLGMRKIPHEGPWFVETYRSADVVGGELAARYDGPRVAGTGICALLTSESFSALHRLATDELWHFYDGAPLELFLIRPDGRGESVILGADLLGGEHRQYAVPGGTWMAARPRPGSPDAYSLIGNTLAPGFEYADYEPGRRDALLAAFPAHAARIVALTREEPSQADSSFV